MYLFIYQTGETQYTPLPALHYIVSPCTCVNVFAWLDCAGKSKIVWKEGEEYKHNKAVVWLIV